MDIRQITQTLEWLDKERRKDRQVLTQLEERLRVSTERNDEYLQRIGKLEAIINEMRGVSESRTNTVQDQIKQFQIEVQRQFEAAETKRVKSEREQERLRDLERESTNRSLIELRKDKDVVTRLSDELKSRRDEENRILRLVNDIETRSRSVYDILEEYQRKTTASIEGVKLDSRKLNELQAELPDIRRRIDELKGKLQVSEDTFLRTETKIGELINLESDRRLSQSAWLEQQSLQVAQRERVLKQVEEQSRDVVQRMEDYASRINIFNETHREMQRALATIFEHTERMERRLSEGGELQRLNEERFRQEWESFMAEEQKKWATHLLLRDEQWREQERKDVKVRDRLQVLENMLTEMNQNIMSIKSSDQQRMQSIFNLMRELMAEYDNTLTRVR
jgi:chromosome segregation ATPase